VFRRLPKPLQLFVNGGIVALANENDADVLVIEPVDDPVLTTVRAVVGETLERPRVMAQPWSFGLANMGDPPALQTLRTGRSVT
jgi:hypothetical protein